MIQNNLSRILGEKRMTQAELARKTKMNKNKICALYHDIEIGLTLKEIDLICSTLCCNIYDLFQYKPIKKHKI